MGKWTKYKDTLRSYQPEADYQDKVEARKLRFSGLAFAELGDAFKKARQLKDALKSELGDVGLDLEAVGQLLLDQMQGMGQESVRLASGGTLTEVPTPYPKLVDEEKFLIWLRDAYPDERLKYPWPSLERLVKERLEEGKPTPPGVEVFLKNVVRLYGGKNADD